MTLDRIMPPYFLKKNKKGSSYRIIIMFFLLCVSVLLITMGDVELLAGVYTISFLSVMALFAIGNVLLKVKRRKLPRPEKASWIAILIAFSAVVVALIGNIVMPPKEGNPSNVIVFLYYFIPAMLFIAVMLNRTVLLKLVLSAVDNVFYGIKRFVKRVDHTILNTLDKINEQEFVFFTKGDNIATLNNVMLYIRKNEHTKKMKIVIITNDKVKKPADFDKEIEFLDKEYPEIDVELVEIDGEEFSPELVQKLSKEWKIPINFMFIGSPGDRFPYKIEEFGGLRLII
jgi:amino acid transporter